MRGKIRMKNRLAWPDTSRLPVFQKCMKTENAISLRGNFEVLSYRGGKATHSNFCAVSEFIATCQQHTTGLWEIHKKHYQEALIADDSKTYVLDA